MTWSTLRLEGRALEQALVLQLEGKRCHGNRGIRMQDADGQWVVVSCQSDVRVKPILDRMGAISGEICDGLEASGFTLRRADQVVELESGETHSVDLVLRRGRGHNLCGSEVVHATQLCAPRWGRNLTRLAGRGGRGLHSDSPRRPAAPTCCIRNRCPLRVTSFVGSGDRWRCGRTGSGGMF